MEQAILMYDPCLRYQCNKKNDSRKSVVYFCKLPLGVDVGVCRYIKAYRNKMLLTQKSGIHPRSIVCGYACSREVELRNTTSLSTNIADLRPSLISAISDSTAMRPISA